MNSVYGMIVVNYDHVAGYLLKYCPGRQISTFELLERLFLAIDEVGRLEGIRFHSALQEHQQPKLISDYRSMLSDFLDIARQSGAVEIRGDIVVKKRLRIKPLAGFQTIRREHPYQVIINEVEHLHSLTRRLRLMAGLPAILVRRRLHRRLLLLDQQQFAADYAAYRVEGESKPMPIGAPFFLKRRGATTGVVLIHGYMAAPEEVRPLAAFLRRQGFSVYNCRLRGHGTSPDDLAGRKWEEWLAAVERAYLVLASSCRNVVLGGFSCGAGLALLAGADFLPGVKAVFAIYPPAKLRWKAAMFAPAVVFWN
jgi:hypothetical protein